jgi:hypothetical protein
MHTKIERRIVWNLLHHLKEHGFVVSGYDDGDGLEPRTLSNVRALEVVASVDESCLYFQKEGNKEAHGVLFVGGNGPEIISDWSYSMNDPDGLNKAMDSFNSDDYV